MKTFIGNDGQYEIDDNGNVIQWMVDSLGKITGKIKEYKDAAKIPNPFDREAVKNMLKLLRIYHFSGRC